MGKTINIETNKTLINNFTPKEIKITFYELRQAFSNDERLRHLRIKITIILTLIAGFFSLKDFLHYQGKLPPDSVYIFFLLILTLGFSFMVSLHHSHTKNEGFKKFSKNINLIEALSFALLAPMIMAVAIMCVRLMQTHAAFIAVPPGALVILLISLFGLLIIAFKIFLDSNEVTALDS